MSATTALAARLARVAPQGARVLVVTDYTAGSSTWIDELTGRLLTDGMRSCRHLRRRPAPGLLYVGEGVGRCLDCHLQTDPTAPGRAGGAVCGRCASVAPALLKTVAVEVGSWVMLSALCPLCEVLLLHEGDQAAAASRNAGR
ncbi:hypothetical protein [Streptomyces mirabilis]|uniref:hypothetical protein n=1 Tax=Streptomyces mirabilis TaxID=68239 RepID=UPI00382C149E